MMLYLLGDLHGGEDMAGLERYLREPHDDDLLLLLGDLSLFFAPTEENRRFTEWFLSLKLPIAFIDGNHENHPWLRRFPIENVFGAPAHRLTEHIVYLKRGEIYTIGGKRFFVMGGCKSSAKWAKMGLAYEGEVPSEDEIEQGYGALAQTGNKVDFVLTHKYLASSSDAPRGTLEGLTHYIDTEVDFTHWYCGHWHRNEQIDDRHTTVFDRAVALQL